MSANAIWYDNDGRFNMDGYISMSPSQLGRAIIGTLMEGNDLLSSFGVTVGYAVEMLRITGRTGRFYDSLANTADHRFDYTRPTVGNFCGEAQSLRQSADAVEDIVNQACLPVGALGEALKVAAQNMRAQADELEREAYDVQDSAAASGACDSLLAAAKQLRKEARQLEKSAERVVAKMVNVVNNGAHTNATVTMRHAADQCDSVPMGNPLAANFTVPTVNDEDPHYGADAIWWDDNTQVFNFGGYRVGSSKLGRLLANALMRGEQHVTVGDMSVHVDDLVEMARTVGETGEFGVLFD